MQIIYKKINVSEIELLFFTESDWNDFIKYQKLIGAKTILYLVKYISKKTDSKTVNYHDVSLLLIYEKRIKRCFFKYMQILEDSVKSLVIDNMYFAPSEENKGEYVKFSKQNYDINDFSALEELHRISDKSIDHNRMIKIMQTLLDNKIITHEYFDKLERCYDLRNWMLHFNSMYIKDNFSIIQDSLEFFATIFPEYIQSEYKKAIDKCKNDLGLSFKDGNQVLFLKNFSKK